MLEDKHSEHILGYFSDVIATARRLDTLDGVEICISTQLDTFK